MQINYLILIFTNSNDKDKLKKYSVDLIQSAENGTRLDNICFKCKLRYTTSLEYNTVHCFICEECIFDFNHHCFWINKCIGENNLYYFYSFLITCALNLSVIFVTSISVYNNLGKLDYKDEFDYTIEKPLYVFPEFMSNYINDESVVRTWAMILICFSGLFLISVLYIIGIHILTEYNSRTKGSMKKAKKYKHIFSSNNSSLNEKLIEVESAHNIDA